MNINRLILLLSLVLFNSCERMLMEPDPQTDPKSIFTEWYSIYHNKYAMFNKNYNVKSVSEWDSLYYQQLAKFDTANTERSLWMSIDTMLGQILDGHSYLYDPQLGYGISYAPGFIRFDTVENSHGDDSLVYVSKPYCYDTTEVVTNSYVTIIDTIHGLTYGTIKNDPTIGYLRFRDFMNPLTEDDMNTAIKAISSTKGAILDIRGNGGGNPVTAAMMSSHFYNTDTIYTGTERFKTGPGANDFKGSDIYTQTSDGELYLKPVVLLTDVGCFSATTTLICYMRVADNHILLGDTTGGGSGSTMDGELANGLVYSLSSSEFVGVDDNGEATKHMNYGLAPNKLVIDTVFTDGTDELIESAIDTLQNWK